jgi:hypothetical protein
VVLHALNICFSIGLGSGRGERRVDVLRGEDVARHGNAVLRCDGVGNVATGDWRRETGEMCDRIEYAVRQMQNKSLRSQRCDAESED